MRVRGIQHLNLQVADLERSRAFYEQVLGFELSFAKGDTIWLEAGSDLLGLSRGVPPTDFPTHFGFQVGSPEEVDAWLGQLEKHGVTIAKGPYDRSDGRSVYFRDPDGYLLEIFWVDPEFPSRNRDVPAPGRGPSRSQGR